MPFVVTSCACKTHRAHTYQPADEPLLKEKCVKFASFGVFLLEIAVCPFKMYRHDASQVSTKKRDLPIFFGGIGIIFA